MSLLIWVALPAIIFGGGSYLVWSIHRFSLPTMWCPSRGRRPPVHHLFRLFRSHAQTSGHAACSTPHDLSAYLSASWFEGRHQIRSVGDELHECVGRLGLMRHELGAVFVAPARKIYHTRRL